MFLHINGYALKKITMNTFKYYKRGVSCQFTYFGFTKGIPEEHFRICIKIQMALSLLKKCQTCNQILKTRKQTQLKTKLGGVNI